MYNPADAIALKVILRAIWIQFWFNLIMAKPDKRGHRLSDRYQRNDRSLQGFI